MSTTNQQSPNHTICKLSTRTSSSQWLAGNWYSSCDINNGGCADECVFETVFCIRAPCPPLVSCQPKENPCNLIDCAPGTTCRVNEKTGAGECIKDICSLKPDPGPCRGSFPSYFFNFKSGQCEKFIYGGCGGNENRFSLLEDCLETCGETEPTENPCNLIDCAPSTLFALPPELCLEDRPSIREMSHETYIVRLQMRMYPTFQ